MNKSWEAVRLGLSSAVCIMCLVYLQGAAAAHDGTDFFGGPPWQDRSVEYYRNQSVNWNNSWITSLNAADATWSEIDSSDGFTFLQQSSEAGGNNCGFVAPSTSTVDRESIDGPAGFLIRMNTCYFGTANEKFYMIIDTDEDWYHTQGDDDVPDTVSAWGVLTHEFGHGAGFGYGGTQDHFAGPCDNSDLLHYQTMCAEPPGIPSDQDEAWRWYSLEQHDIHEFEAEY